MKHITSAMNSDISAASIPVLAPTTYCPPCPDVCDATEEEAMEEINDELLL